MKASRQKRIELINKLEEMTNSHIIVYFVGDRPLAKAQIADDAVRPMYDHIRSIKKLPSDKKLSLFLYSRGGHMEVPWKIVTMFRSHTEEFDVIVPYKAYSAATMIALGADNIWMSKKAELGPIDPSLSPVAKKAEMAQQGPFAFGELGTEDVSAYIRFIRNRAGLTEQDALARMIQLLADNITPVLLGKIERIHSHIRLAAQKLLSKHKIPLDSHQINTIIEALTEKSYVHGHSIGREEAKDIGLTVKDMDGELEDTAWSLYLEYEKQFNLNSSKDPRTYFTEGGPDIYLEDEVILACIESKEIIHSYTGTLELRRTRKLPSQPTININLGLQLPPEVDISNLPESIQKTIKYNINQVSEDIRKIVQEELRRQSPVEEISVNVLGGLWKEETALANNGL